MQGLQQIIAKSQPFETAARNGQAAPAYGSNGHPPARTWVVRRGKPGDETVIAAATRRMASETEDKATIPGLLEAWVHTVLKARDGTTLYILAEGSRGEFGGFFLLSEQPSDFAASKYLSIDTAYTEPAYRQEGIGTQLLEHAQRIAQEIDAAEIRLMVLATNTTGLRFWLNQGCEATGYIVMRKHVIPSGMALP